MQDKPELIQCPVANNDVTRGRNSSDDEFDDADRSGPMIYGDYLMASVDFVFICLKSFVHTQIAQLFLNDRSFLHMFLFGSHS